MKFTFKNKNEYDCIYTHILQVNLLCVSMISNHNSHPYQVLNPLHLILGLIIYYNNFVRAQQLIKHYGQEFYLLCTQFIFEYYIFNRCNSKKTLLSYLCCINEETYVGRIRIDVAIPRICAYPTLFYIKHIFDINFSMTVLHFHFAFLQKCVSVVIVQL